MNASELQAQGPYHCLNCGTEVPQNFCPHCGQKRIPERLTVHELQHDMVHGWLHADRSIFKFAWNVLIRPGHVAKEYLSGKRKRYFPIVQFFFITSAISVFILSTTGLAKYIMNNNAAVQSSIASKNPQQLKMQLQVQQQMNEVVMPFLFKYSALINMAMIPMFVAMLYFLYKKRKLGFAERYLLVLTAFNQYNVISIFLNLIMWMIGPAVASHIFTIIYPVLFACMGITLTQFFGGNWLLHTFKGIVAMVGGFAILILSIGIISVGVGIVIASGVIKFP